ncbi:uncharacterized protein A1O9_03707, partial [Exophiala aquamarina CBS 119918]
MASSLRRPQTICGELSKAASPRYVCHSCRRNLPRSSSQPSRAVSTFLSSDRSRHSQNSTEVQAHPRAPYATKPFEKYINVQKKQPIQDLKEWGPDKAPAEYEEATTWVGIEILGQERPLGDLDKSTDRFKPFMRHTPGQQVNREYFLAHLYDAIVDVWVCKTLQRNFAELYTTPPNVYARVAAASSGFDVTESGTIAGLQMDTKTLKEAIKQAIKDKKRNSDITDVDIEELMGQLKLDFSDPTTFEILKYFSFISHHRVPDPILSNVWNNDKPLAGFLDLLTRHYVQTASKTVASTLQARQEKALLAAQSDQLADVNNSETEPKPRRKIEPLGPNVMVLSRRETPVDKEKEVGRWKLIEKELIERGLPVLGRR